MEKEKPAAFLADSSENSAKDASGQQAMAGPGAPVGFVCRPRSAQVDSSSSPVARS